MYQYNNLDTPLDIAYVLLIISIAFIMLFAFIILSYTSSHTVQFSIDEISTYMKENKIQFISYHRNLDGCYMVSTRNGVFNNFGISSYFDPKNIQIMTEQQRYLERLTSFLKIQRDDIDEKYRKIMKYINDNDLFDGIKKYKVTPDEYLYWIFPDLSLPLTESDLEEGLSIFNIKKYLLRDSRELAF
jgi:hypothetical protein